MYYFAFVLLALSMLCALAGALWAVKSLWPRPAPAAGKAQRRTSVPGLGFIEKANLCLTGCYVIASAILIYALASYDFSLVYVASYTDRLLPLFYRITAFWAGQAGSMLFWAFSVAICGGLFQLTRSYYPVLLKAGARIFEYTPGFCHAKQCVSDDKAAVVGTINLDYRSLYHHFENAAAFYHKDAVAGVKADFDHLFEECHEVTEQYRSHRSTALRVGQCILRLLAPLL